MNYRKKVTKGAEIAYSAFEGKLSTEYNLMVVPVCGGTIDEQLDAIKYSVAEFMTENGTNPDSIAFQRFFVSDFTNQSEILKKADLFGCNCAVSIVQQTPLNGAKVGLWCNIIESKTDEPFAKSKSENKLVIQHNGYKHVYSTQLHGEGSKCSYVQTNQIFNDYLEVLKDQKLTLEEHCIRTWFYVRDIDNNYAGMVKARNEIFDQYQLTKDTHFIASTGIEGRFADPTVSVLLDAYAVGGIAPEQVRFLEALDHLNPTHEYGVAFERATSVDYGDRRQIFISGTASIDSRGEIVHVGDIYGQIVRTFENIKALLAEGEANMNDVNSMIVYLRDVADTADVNNFIKANYPEIPYIIVHAPVCRPGWLIEIECIAIKAIENSNFNCY